MRILLTNDDGIHAEGMQVLMNWARRLGDISVYAPRVEQSGKSHSIEIHRPFEVRQVDLFDGSRGYAVDSTPADCVRFAILGMKEHFDLVLSGVNRGLNIGRDTNYSGTVSAALEAAMLGVPAVALSTEPASFDAARAHLDEVWAYIQSRRLLERASVLNVNIPHAVKGDIRLTHLGGPYYSDDFPHIGNDLYRPTGHSIHVDRGDYSLDTDATLNGFITVTPMTIDRTDWRLYEELSAADH